MSTPENARPRQVTMAAWMIMLGSAFVVLTVFELVSGLRSIETREAVEDFLSAPPAEGTGLSTETALTLLKTAGMVAAGCATAAAILGFHVLKRNRHARTALTILAAPLFVSGLVAGGFMSALVVVASVMLWFSPAREWFDGKPIPKPGRGDAERRVFGHDRPLPPLGQPPGQKPGQAPGQQAPGQEAPAEAPPVHQPTPGDQPGDQPGDEPAGPRPADRPFGTAPARGSSVPMGAQQAAPLPHGADRRPDAVVVAAILTWIFAGLVLLSSLSGVVLMATSPEAMFEELERSAPQLAEQGISNEMVRITTFVTGALAIVWCVAAMALAALMLGRRRWAARGLILVATLSAMISLAAMIGSIVMVIPAAAALMTVLCLRQPGVVQWFHGADR